MGYGMGFAEYKWVSISELSDGLVILAGANVSELADG